MNRIWLHISTPPPPGSLTYIKHPTSAILHLVTVCITCAIKPLYVTYLHTTGGEKHLLQIWSRPSFKPFPRANWPGTRVLADRREGGRGGSSTWLQVEGWVQCSATKANGNLLPRREGPRGLRLDCSWDYLHTSLGNRYHTSKIFLAQEISSCLRTKTHFQI